MLRAFQRSPGFGGCLCYLFILLLQPGESTLHFICMKVRGGKPTPLLITIIISNLIAVCRVRTKAFDKSFKVLLFLFPADLPQQRISACRSWDSSRLVADQAAYCDTPANKHAPFRRVGCRRDRGVCLTGSHSVRNILRCSCASPFSSSFASPSTSSSPSPPACESGDFAHQWVI